MWRVVKAELQYNVWTLAMFVLVPLLYIFERDDSATYMLTLMAFLMINGLLPVRYKENRDRQHAMLPLTPREVGVTRIAPVLAFGLGIFGSYLLIQTVHQGWNAGTSMELILGFGAISTAYSAWFIGSDVLPGGARSSRVVTGVLLASGLLLTMGLVTMVLMARADSGAAPPRAVLMFRSAIDTVVAANPFAGELGAVKLLIFGLLLSGVSVLTYGRRRTYLR